MNFSQVCVMIVLFLIISLGGYLIDYISDTDGALSWLFSSFGFTVCLTILLIDYGII